MARLKILFLSQIVPYPPQGGVLQRIYNILKELGKETDIYLLAFNHADVLDSEEKIKEAKKSLLKFCKFVEIYPLEVKESKFKFYFALLRSFFSLKPFSVIAHNSQLFRQSFKKLENQYYFDIVHYDTIALAQYETQNKTVIKSITHHNVESDLIMRRSKAAKNPLKKLFLYLNGLKLAKCEKKVIGQFNGNITCSDIDKDKLLSINSKAKIYVIPNGVDCSYFVPNSDKEKNGTIIHVGALQSSNLDGINYFLNHIWHLIKKRRKDAKLMLVGGSVPNSIRKLGETADDIQVTGYVPDVRPYVWNAAVFIVPLRIGGGTRLKILDALSMEKAVVSTTIGAEGIEVTHGENIMIADRPKEFAEYVVKLIENPTERKKIGINGRKLTQKNYDWSLIGMRQLDVFNNMLKSR